MSVVSSEEQVIRDYKQTEVGLIPIDWEVKKIGEVSHLSVGGDLDEEKFSEYQDNIYQYPVYSNTVENRGLYGYYKTAEFKGDSVTVVGRGIGIGTAFKRDIEYGAIGRLLVLYPDDKVDSNYLTEIINYRLKVFEESSGIPQLTGVSFAGYKIPLPPTKAEQTAIATALSDADAFIQSLEKLIVKKRLIKQGAMQELLKPKEGWVVKKLGEVCIYINDGTHHTPRYVNEGIPFYSVENVTSDNFKHVKFITKEEHEELIKRCKPERGDILLTRIGSIGKTKLIDWDVNASIYVSLALLKIGDNIDSRYLYMYTKSRQFSLDIENRSLMNAVPQKINMGDIHSVPISLPPDINEQVRIAKILSDMDTEISTLESKLEKYKQIKQGMMQNLLTGKIRLV